MNLYAESSAVLSWLLSNRHGDRVIESLNNAKLVFASELTLVECDRTLVRATHTGELSQAVSADRVAQLYS